MDHLAFMLEPVSPQALQLYCLKATFHQQASVPVPGASLLTETSCQCLGLWLPVTASQVAEDNRTFPA